MVSSIISLSQYNLPLKVFINLAGDGQSCPSTWVPMNASPTYCTLLDRVLQNTEKNLMSLTYSPICSINPLTSYKYMSCPFLYLAISSVIFTNVIIFRFTLSFCLWFVCILISLSQRWITIRSKCPFSDNLTFIKTNPLIAEHLYDNKDK